MALYTVLVATLSAHYLTYLVTRSEFPPVTRARDWAFDRWEGSWQTYLITCGYCTAFYVSAVIIALADVVSHVPLPVLLWLSCASAAGTLIELVDTLRSVTMRSR